MAIDVVRWTIAALFAALLAIASVSDIRHRRIPNWTVLAICALWIPWILAGQVASVPWSITAAIFVFAVGVALYAMGLWGAGDSKLVTAVVLFIGWGRLGEFAFTTAIFGGILALIILLSNPTRVLVMVQMRGKGEAVSTVPYGVAIAVGAVLTVFRALAFAPA
jgi:prepilin peptidase CpaA